MGSLLTSISGAFGQGIILGAFFPAAIFVLLGIVALLWPPAGRLAAFFAAESEYNLANVVAVITFAILVVTGILYNLNSVIIRFFEGYPWRATLAGRIMTTRQQRRFHALQHRATALEALVEAREQMPGFRQEEDIQATLRAEAGRSLRELRLSFPFDASYVLPTRLGNIIRKSESYAYREYGMEPISLWPRLLGVVDAAYLAKLESARVSLTFLLNSALLSMILALGLLMNAFVRQPSTWSWVFLFLGFFICSLLLYRASLSSAAAWGNLVEGAFDLYRWDLLKKLGYSRVPQTRQSEVALWREISRQILLGKSASGGALVYDASREE